MFQKIAITIFFLNYIISYIILVLKTLEKIFFLDVNISDETSTVTFLVQRNFICYNIPFLHSSNSDYKGQVIKIDFRIKY